MKFLDAEFVQGFIRMANDGWEQGWHERNHGICQALFLRLQNLQSFHTLKILWLMSR